MTTQPATSSALLARKAAAVSTRQRIEHLATSEWADFTGEKFDTLSHSNVAMRLKLLAAIGPVAEHRENYELALALGHVYKETSDVLHGRLRAMNLPLVRVQEWEVMVARGEALRASKKTS